MKNENSVALLRSENNVLSDQEFKGRVSEVFSCISDAVSKTLGPFGQTTIIEQYGEMHVTKDGWTVLKGISFDENIDNNILYLLTKIAAQVVVKVGDGSTSSIVAADNILKEFYNSDIVNIDFGPREFAENLSKLVNDIVENIQKKSIKINSDDFDEEKDRNIYKLAMISTNGNHDISNMISDIYRLTNNPTVSFSKGSYSDHNLEIVTGYKAQLRLLDGIYITGDSGKRTDKNPMVIMFDHRVDSEHFTNIIMPAREYANNNGKLLYIIAPHYNDAVLQRIKHDTNLFFKSTQGRFQDVYTKISIVSNLQRQMYSDLACLLGATIIDDSMIGELTTNEGELKIVDMIGTCGTITSDLKDSLFSDLDNKDEALYNVIMNDAVSRYNEAKVRFARMDIISPEVIDMKNRISKLKCKLGVISVGGISTLEQSANMDLVDDAVKACESAFNFGYNLGCSLIVPIVIDEMMGEYESFSSKQKQILDMISNAFLGVYRRIVLNKYNQTNVSESDISARIDEIVNNSFENKQCCNLVTGMLDNDIINPSRTDIEILKASSSIASLLLTSNQYLTIRIPKQ